MAGRKKHVQQELFRRGGKRKGAGRKPKGWRAGSKHEKRPTVRPYHALHVTMRVVPEVGALRKAKLYKALRGATITAAIKQRIRIVHVSIQNTHVHMLVEAKNQNLLARGMQGFQISAARNINTALGERGQRRCGQVFADRYHLTVITSPTQARHALSYVLNNWRRHNEDQSSLASTWLVDPFSTGVLFPGWKEREDHHFLWPIRETYDPLVVFLPECWLLKEGWKTSGPISYREVPARSMRSAR